MCDGFEHRTEGGVGCRHGEAKCHERCNSRVGYGAPNTNCDYYERVEGPRVWVARTGDEACYRGTRIPQEPGSDGLSRRGVDCYLIMVSVRGFTPEPTKPI